MTYAISDEGLGVSLAGEAAPRFEPALRLTEILKSEPATEAVLLRQAANDIADDCEDEIVTAHARPVARPLDGVRSAARRAFAVRLAPHNFDWLAFRTRSIGSRVHDTVAAGAARFAAAVLAASRLAATRIAASERASRTVWQAAMEQVRARQVEPARRTAMPAKSKAQQKAAGAALSAKRGETKPSQLIGASRQMYDSMNEEQLDEFASTKRKGKPDYVEGSPIPARKAARKQAAKKAANTRAQRTAKKTTKARPATKRSAKKRPAKKR